MRAVASGGRWDEFERRKTDDDDEDDDAKGKKCTTTGVKKGRFFGWIKKNKKPVS